MLSAADALATVGISMLQNFDSNSSDEIHHDLIKELEREKETSQRLEAHLLQLKTELDNVKSSLDQKNVAIEQCKAALAALRETIKQLEVDFNSASRELEDAAKAVDDAKLAVEKLEMELKDLADKKTKLQEEIAELQKLIQDITEQQTAMGNNLFNQQLVIQELTLELELKKEELKDVEYEITEKKELVKELKAKESSLEDDLEKMEMKLEQDQADKRDAEMEMAHVENEMNRLIAERNQLQQMIDATNKQLQADMNELAATTDYTRTESSWIFFKKTVTVSRQDERNVIQNRINHGNNVLKSLQDKHSDMGKKIDKHGNRKVELGRKIIRMDSTISSTRTHMNSKMQKLSLIQHEIGTEKNNLSELNGQRKGLQREVINLQHRKLLSVANEQKLLEKRNTIDGQITQKQTALSTLTSNERTLNSQITDAKHQYSVAHTKLTEKAEKYQKALQNKEATAKQIQQKEGEFKELQASKELLQEQVSQQQSVYNSYITQFQSSKNTVKQVEDKQKDHVQNKQRINQVLGQLNTLVQPVQQQSRSYNKYQ